MSEGTESVTSAAQLVCKSADSHDVVASSSTGSTDGVKPGPTAGGGGGKLESLSRDDLIKFVKKQTVLLTKTRSSAEVLAEEKKALEAKLAMEAERAAMLEEDHQAAVAAYNAAQEAQAQAVIQIKALEEQLQAAHERQRHQQSLPAGVGVPREQALVEEIECLKMKNATLTDSVRRLQADYQALAAERSELSAEIDRVRSSAREASSAVVEAEVHRACHLALDEQRLAADAVHAELAASRTAFGDLSRQLDDERRSVSEAAARLAEVERSVAVALQQRIGEHAAAAASAAATVAGLEAKLATAAAELDSLRCLHKSAADDATERLREALDRAETLALAESRAVAELELVRTQLAVVPELVERLRKAEAAVVTLRSELDGQRLEAAERDAERRLASADADRDRAESERRLASAEADRDRAQSERLACERLAEADASELRATIKCLDEELLAERQQRQELQCEQQAARQQQEESMQRCQETLRLVQDLEAQRQGLEQQRDELVQLQLELERQQREQQQRTLELCRQQELVQQQRQEIEQQQLDAQQQQQQLKEELRLLQERFEQQREKLVQEAADGHRQELQRKEDELQQERQEREGLRLQHHEQQTQLECQVQLVADLRSSLAELDSRCGALAERAAAAERNADAAAEELERLRQSELVEHSSERISGEADQQTAGARSAGDSAVRLRELLRDIVGLLRRADSVDESQTDVAEMGISSCATRSEPDDGKRHVEIADTQDAATSDSAKPFELLSPAAGDDNAVGGSRAGACNNDDDQELAKQALNLAGRLARQREALTLSVRQALAARSESERLSSDLRITAAADAASCAEMRQRLERETDRFQRELQCALSDCELLRGRCDELQLALRRAEELECELRGADNDRRRRCEQLESDLSLAAGTVESLRSQCSTVAEDAARSRADLEGLLGKQTALHDAADAARTDLLLVQRDLQAERERSLALDAELRRLQHEAGGHSAEHEKIARELYDMLAERDDLAKRLQTSTEALRRAEELRDAAERAVAQATAAAALQPDADAQHQASSEAPALQIGGADDDTSRRSLLHGQTAAVASVREHESEAATATREHESDATGNTRASCTRISEAVGAHEIQADEAADTKLAELEARCSKFKAIALKAKKETAELKKSYDQAAADVKRLVTEKAVLAEQLQSDAERFATARAELATTLQNLQRTYESVHAALDLEQGRRAELEQAMTRAARELADAREQLGEACASRDSLERQLDAAVKKAVAAETLSTEQAARTAVAEREKEALRRQLGDSEAAAASARQAEEAWRAEEARLRSEIKVQEERLQAALAELERLRQTISKSSLIDLEIADYEKAVEAFQARLQEKHVTIDALQKDLEHAQQRVQSLESQLELSEGQRKQAEERGDKMKQLYAKMRKELADAKDLEMQLRNEEAMLRGQAEAAKQREDASRVELTETIAARSTLEERLRVAGEAQQRLAAAHELRQRRLQDDLGAAQERLAALQADYDGYKVRVHSVLKQQKSKSSAEAALEVEREARTRLEIVVEQLKTKLAESSNNLDAVTKEREALQEEHERLLSRHAGCAQELREKEAHWKQRLETANADAALAAAQTEAAERDQRSAHTELLRRALDEQRQSLSAEYERARSARDVAIAEADDERQRLQREVRELQRQLQAAPSSASAGAAAAATKYHSQPRHQHWAASSAAGERLATPSGDDSVAAQEMCSYRQDSSEMGNVDGAFPPSTLPLLQREEGEGMEQPASPGPFQLHQQLQLQLQNRHVLFGSAQPMSPAASGLVPFEQLLADDAVSVRSMGSAVPPDDGSGGTLKLRLLSLERQAEHLRELLNETEISNNHLREQSRVLKEEIRRLERNQERDNSISNMEYLKNVVLKFLSLKSGEEKAQLVSVLSTMLRLSQEECYQVECAARGSDAQVVSGISPAAAQRGWGAYIPRWTGLS